MCSVGSFYFVGMQKSSKCLHFSRLTGGVAIGSNHMAVKAAADLDAITFNDRGVAALDVLASWTPVVTVVAPGPGCGSSETLPT